MKPLGYNRKILWVDLSQQHTEILRPDELFYRTYLGGVGIGAYYLLKHLQEDCDALSPENILVFAPGLLTGHQAPCVPRYTVMAKSPLTGAIGKSEAGGFWGPELKKAGYDAIVIVGKAPHWVYIWIADEKVEIRNATSLFGMDTGDTEDFIRQDTGEKRARVLSIGPGGENLVRFAGIVSDLSHFNGRNGLGAVMGSKNLKAVAVIGTGKIPSEDPEKLLEISRWVGQNAGKHPLSAALHYMGTPSGMEGNNAGGCLPTRNWTAGVFEAAGEIGGELLTQEYLVGRGGCYACPIRCKRVVEINEPGLTVEKRYGGPEYETLAALGSNCGIGNLKLLCKANELCNRYTIDTISTGMVISMAMACYEKGIITKEDTGGLALHFGNEDVLLQLIKDIAYRKGFGNTLADGASNAAEVIGNGAHEMLIQVKGQDVPMHDPRVKAGLGLQFALSPNGADHWFAQHDPFFTTDESLGIKEIAPLGILEPVPAFDIGPNKVRLILYTSILNFMYDCLGVCFFGAVARSLIPVNCFVDMVRAATGWNTSLWELMKVGERVNALTRLFNHRQGLDSRQDVLPKTFFKAHESGPLKDKNAICPEAFDQAVKLYYEMAGWNRDTGIPTHAKLHELGLGEFIEKGNGG